MKLPKCDFCSHLHEEIRDELCCDAFPDGIPPEKITWGDKDAECANGIKFEAEDGEYEDFVPEPGSLLAKMHRV